jgi:RNA methyltransferase, TrmH family
MVNQLSKIRCSIFQKLLINDKNILQMKELQKITSRENQKLKFAKKVRDGKVANKIFVEGVRLAEEILRSNLIIDEVFINENFIDSERERELINSLLADSVSIFEISDAIFQTIADTNQSQGIIIIAEKPQSSKSKIEEKLINNKLKSALVILLFEINNPSNLGAILRTAEAADVVGVIISENSADVYSAKSIRGAMGANLRLPIWSNADFDEVLTWANQQNLITTAADINAKESYTEIDWNQRRLLVFGSEAHGLSDEARLKIDELTFIPMENGVESLNLAVSCGIILFEAKRQKFSK